MQINSLTLNNFSSYEGINYFDFSPNEGQNIILIGGLNGAGKTSLFSAIKVALYGPLAFGYVGVNSHYTKKIKEYINSKAFQKENVEASVTINISIMVDREIEDYEITRSWCYLNQKLEEQHFVKKNNRILNDQELAYFHNYLLGVIPPSLFDFFLFDGEEVGSIFSTSNYNTYVKNALFTMCDMDVFELIRKYAGSYVGKTEDGSDGAEVEAEYKANQLAVEKIEKNIERNEIRVGEIREKLEEIDLELTEIDTAFKQAGGMSITEKEALRQELLNYEHVKQESSLKIKSFVENLMPFFIVKDFADNITKQLDYEEKVELFEYLTFKLQGDSFKKNLKTDVSEDNINDVINAVLTTIRPSGYVDDSEPLHGVSKDEANRINGVISAIQDFDKEELLAAIEKKEQASDNTIRINQIMKSALSEEDEKAYASRENKLLKGQAKYTSELLELEQKLNEQNAEKVELQADGNRLYQKLVSSVQNAHVYELSSGLSKMMQKLLQNKTDDIRKKLEYQIVKNLRSIYRKDNLITHVEIEDNYQFNLYQNATYYEGELLSLIKNVGNDEAVRLIGKKGTSELFKRYGVASIAELKQALVDSSRMTMVDTYKRVDLSRLSKGERQIFILALYWAIIFISGKNIPFVIDTPYARIDANHRKEISEKFFPRISKQVIILSTDEEINQEYYDIIYPYIAKEYLLSNDEESNKTTVENKYFFEVTK